MTLLISIALLVLLLVYAISIYNRLVRRSAVVGEAFSGIDVQLKRRADLIPNLVETVKGYMGHERQLLEKVAELRSRALAADAPEEKASLAASLSSSLASLFAVAENYPELKANENFISLQQELSSIEEQLQSARRFYNGAVRDLNIAVRSFPSNLVASAFGFFRAEYFEIEDGADRNTPSVSF